MVRSLDVQQVLLQSNAIERVQQIQQHQTEVQQKHFEAQLAEDKRKLKEKVKDLEETERLMIREDEERGKREKNTGENSAKKKKDDADTADKPLGKIDIRV
jgi:mannitol-specific phosphotransferase system IIBC component